MILNQRARKNGDAKPYPPVPLTSAFGYDCD